MKRPIVILAMLSLAFSSLQSYAADRTTRIIPWTQENVDIVDNWAKANGYRELKNKRTEGHRIYKRGHYLMTAPVVVEVIKHDWNDKGHVDAYIKPDPVSRVLSLWILPSNMGLESGGIKAAMPRSINRGSVNVLFSLLKVDPIY